MTVHIHNTDLFINLEIDFWMVFFWDSLILYQIDDTEILNVILMYHITFLSLFSHLAHAWPRPNRWVKKILQTFWNILLSFKFQIFQSRNMKAMVKDKESQYRSYLVHSIDI